MRERANGKYPTASRMGRDGRGAARAAVVGGSVGVKSEEFDVTGTTNSTGGGRARGTLLVRTQKGGCEEALTRKRVEKKPHVGLPRVLRAVPRKRCGNCLKPDLDQSASIPRALLKNGSNVVPGAVYGVVSEECPGAV